MDNHILEIEELIELNINGTNQYVLIRGCKKDNPVLLYLHGGPGVSNMYLYPYEKELEKRFVVIKWDQRGTAKSNNNIDKSTLNLNQFISDTYEICKYINKRFSKKIYLVAHSWGSLLGIEIVNKHPELFLGYIGVGQLVNDFKSEQLSYKFILLKAREYNNKLDIMKIKRIMKLPYRNSNTAKTIEKYIYKYGGSFYNKKNNFINIFLVMKCKYYTIRDLFKLLKGLNVNQNLMSEILNVDLFKKSRDFKVPIYIFAGKYDYITSSIVAKEYYDFINAPNKKIVYFENSAHSPNIEEYKKFSEEVINCFCNISPIRSKIIN